MKKKLFWFAMFAAIFLLIGCGGSDNGCKDLYNCIKDCNSERCEYECYEGTTNSEQEAYRNLRNCLEDWDDGDGQGMSQKAYCSAEYKACGM